MTPDEFNRIGSQVQREIFERYFEDLNQQVRTLQTDLDYSDRVFNVEEKIAEFKTEINLSETSGTNPPFNSFYSLPDSLYRLGSLTYEGGMNIAEVQNVDRREYYRVIKSPLTKPSKKDPIYLYEDNKAIVFPSNLGKLRAQYVKKPGEIRWGFTLGSVGQYEFTDYQFQADGLVVEQEYAVDSSTVNTVTDAGADRTIVVDSSNYTITPSSFNGNYPTFEIVVQNSAVVSVTVSTSGSGLSLDDVITFNVTGIFGAQALGNLSIKVNTLMGSTTNGFNNFELHNSERIELVTNILLYAGVVIRDPQIIQTAMQQSAQEDRNEKT